MFGNRKNFQNNQRSQRQSGSTAGVCTCPRCGYSTPHQAGIPCKSLICPSCKVPLLRGELTVENKVNNSEQALISTPVISTPSVKPYPVVDAELCVGCETCVEACPANAILMVDGQAVIQNELCRKCRKCVSACPVEAIS